MFRRCARVGRPLAVLVVMIAVAMLGAISLIGRWRISGGDDRMWSSVWGSRDDAASMDRPSTGAMPGGRRSRAPERSFLPTNAGDRRLDPLRRAAESWRLATGPVRVVVDQVCLVPDVPSFFEAIAAWDEGHFFPILIDEPAWTLPFLRAFRPARVVRYAANRAGEAKPGPRRSGSGSAAARLELWLDAVGAVSRAWSTPGPDERRSPGGASPRGLGETPPGLVLSSPDSPMLAGAVALAAGRFQPLIRLEPDLWDLHDPGDSSAIRYEEVLTLPTAWRFARRLESRVEGVTRRYAQLGDDCDFLTIAGDWPYRYDDDVEGGMARGIHALDDLIGRNLEGEPDARGLNGARRRWAFAGRLLGDPAASVARAMGALFLAPDAALLWNTYASGQPWSAYSLAPAAGRFARAGVAPRGIFHAAAQSASLANWHHLMDPSNRFGLIWLNSTGSPTDFSITGGPGRPADVPGGCPASVVMFHSHSAADPASPRTIAGRWLAQGAFVYYGSVNEPFLTAFRLPALVAELSTEGVPLSAALRQGEYEPFGRPWRLIYLGDPLYRLSRPAPAEGRLAPDAWRVLEPSYAGWPTVEVVAMSAPAAPSGRVLEWCRDAAIAELAGGPRADARRPTLAWRSDLKTIRRGQLDPRLRPTFDDLLIDALGQSGEWDELQSLLSRIPTAERRDRVWIAMETGAMLRLARAARDAKADRGLDRALDLWDEVIRLDWPPGSEFPAQFTERMAKLVESVEAPRRLPAWRDRLRRAAGEMDARPGGFHHAAVVAGERERVESKLRRSD